MKRDMWKIMVLIGIGIIPCQIEILGCFPLLVAFYTAVYMEDFYRGGFTLFMYLWMILWLPMTRLGKYGITLLVTMVAIIFAERMYQSCRKVYAAAVSSLVLMLVSLGGQTFLDVNKGSYWVILLEGLMTFSLGILLNREIGLFVSRPTRYETEQEELQEEQTQYKEYARALTGLSATFTRMSRQRGEMTEPQLVKMQKELELKVCNSCGQCSICWEGQQTMSYLLQQT